MQSEIWPYILAYVLFPTPSLVAYVQTDTCKLNLRIFQNKLLYDFMSPSFPLITDFNSLPELYSFTLLLGLNRQGLGN